MDYNGGPDGLRLFCEILSVIFLWVYAFEEINQAERCGLTEYCSRLHVYFTACICLSYVLSFVLSLQRGLVLLQGPVQLL